MKIGDRVYKPDPDKDTDKILGTIESFSTNNNQELIVIVNWDNGEKTKELRRNIELLIEETPDPDSVTISRSDFHDLSMKVINPNNFQNVDAYYLEIYQIVGLDIFRRLEKELFGAKAEND